MGIQPHLRQEGISLVFKINQYINGSLVATKDTLNIGAYPGNGQVLETLPWVPTIRPDADEVKLVIDTAYWYYNPPGPYTPSGTLALYCQTSDFQFAYNKRGLLEQKSMPDQGTTNYLYDKNGNVRLVRDAVHSGAAANNTHLWGNINTPNSTSGQFTLTMPGPVTITTTVYYVNNASETIKIKANGVYVLATTSAVPS